MSALDRNVLAERTMVVRRHLARVAERLPRTADELRPATDASDAVVFHLWQAVQVVIDLALAACLRLDLGTPTTYADAFRRLAGAGVIDQALAERLSRAAGFATSSPTRTTSSTWPASSGSLGRDRRISRHFWPPCVTVSPPPVSRAVDRLRTPWTS